MRAYQPGALIPAFLRIQPFPLLTEGSGGAANAGARTATKLEAAKPCHKPSWATSRALDSESFTVTR